MNCNAVKSLLRARFDSGQPLEPGLEGHLETCAACVRFRDRLAALDGCLAALPLERPAPGFVVRVGRRVAEDTARQRRLDVAAQVSGAVLVVATAAFLGWYYPLEFRLQPWTWWKTITSWFAEIATPDWRGWLSGTAALAHAAWESATEWVWGGLDRLVAVPPIIVWPVVVCFVLFLIIFNGAEAHRMGGTKGGS